MSGLRVQRRCRETGHLVGLYDGITEGMDTDAGRWQTVVVIGTSPFAPESVVVGPFRSPEMAYVAARQLEHLGYVAETCQLIGIRDIPPLDGAGEWD